MPLCKPFGFFGSQSERLLLDLYPNAEFAYSIRKLRTAYTGNCVKLRRVVDNAEKDFGFDADGYIDQAAIETWRTSVANATRLRVITWYDQSQNATNLVEDSEALAPDFYNSTDGGYFTSLGKYAINFAGTGVQSMYLTMRNRDPNVIGDTSTFIVHTPNSSPAGQEGVMLQVAKEDDATSQFSGVSIGMNGAGATDGYFVTLTSGSAATNLNGFTTTSTNGNILSTVINFTANTNTFKYNNSAKTDVVNGISYAGTGAPLQVGGITQPSAPFDQFYAAFKANEIIMYSSNQSSNESDILTNMNDFYSAY